MAGAATVNKGDKRRVSGPYTIEVRKFYDQARPR